MLIWFFIIEIVLGLLFAAMGAYVGVALAEAKINHKFFLQQKCYINTFFSNQNIFFTFLFVLEYN